MRAKWSSGNSCSSLTELFVPSPFPFRAAPGRSTSYRSVLGFRPAPLESLTAAHTTSEATGSDPDGLHFCSKYYIRSCLWLSVVTFSLIIECNAFFTLQSKGQINKDFQVSSEWLRLKLLALALPQKSQISSVFTSAYHSLHVSRMNIWILHRNSCFTVQSSVYIWHFCLCVVSTLFNHKTHSNI